MNGSLVDKLEGESGLYECIQKYDCVFMSETWTNESCDVDVKGFISFCKHRKRKKRAKRDSGGLVVYFKENIANGVHEEKWDDFEDGLCFRLDKDIFGWEEDIYLFCVYMRPNASTREGVNIDMNCYDMLEDQLARMSQKGGIIVVGDMNARTAQKQECLVVNESELCSERVDVSGMQHIPTEHVICESDIVNNGMCVERVNGDSGTNEYGTRLVNLTTAADMLFLNGRAGSDKGVGRKTFFNHRGESAIDYVICNKYSLCKIIDFHVHDPNVYSDHVMLSFSMSTGVDFDVSKSDCKRDRVYAKWKQERKNEFTENVLSQEVREKVDELSEMIVNNTSTDVLEDVVVGVTDILVTAGSGHIHTVKQGSGGNVQGRRKASWYDEACAKQHKVFLECERRFYDERSEENRASMCVERNVYRKICRQKINEFKRDLSVRLFDISKSNPKAF